MSLKVSYTTEYPHIPIKTKEFTFIYTIEACKTPDDYSRSPVSITAVADKSGSMSGQKIELLKRALEYLVHALQNGDNLGIVSYNTQSKIDQNLTSINDLSKNEIREAIEKIKTAGGTNLSDGLFDGLEQQKDADVGATSVKSVILFTDGLANYGITKAGEIADKMKDYLDMKFPPTVNTMGYGIDHDSDFLQIIADAGQGMYYFVENEEDIPKAIGLITGGLLSVTSQNVKIEMVPKGRCKIESIKGSNVSQTSSGWSVNYADIYAEEKRDILVNMAIPVELEPIEAQPVMTINLSYYNTLTKQDVNEVKEIIIARKDEPLPPEANTAVNIVKLRHRAVFDIQAALDMHTRGNVEIARNILVDIQKLCGQQAFDDVAEIKKLSSDVSNIESQFRAAVVDQAQRTQMSRGMESYSRQRAVASSDKSVSYVTSTAQEYQSYNADRFSRNKALKQHERQYKTR